LLLEALVINTMSKYLAKFLMVAGFVSGQGFYSSPEGTTEAVDTTTPTGAASSTIAFVATLPATTSSSILAAALDSSVTDTSTSSYTTKTFYYCTTPTFSAIGPFVTVYNTAYVDVCPTGLTSVTYTITDTCGCQHETDYTRPTGCPSGFTVTEKTCTMCPGSPVITCTTPIAPIGPASEISNPTSGIVGSSQGSNPQYTQNQIPPYTQSGSTPSSGSRPSSGSTPSSAPGTKPFYQTTNSAMPAAGSSPLGLIMVMSMALVAGLMCIL
jgi:chitinase